MDRKQEEEVIARYQQDEENMILIFVQWCINHDIDPEALYQKAYPNQPVNKKLAEAVGNASPKEEAEEISHDLMLEILELFGNHDLAHVVYKEVKKKGMPDT